MGPIDAHNLEMLLEREKQKGRRIGVAYSVYIVIELCKRLEDLHARPAPAIAPGSDTVGATVWATGEIGGAMREITPANILISKDGDVWLTDVDVALARHQADESVDTLKFSYLSPEAASGLDADARSDVFAVGIMLWEMLTGRGLFRGETGYQTVELVREARVPAIAAQQPDIEGDLEVIVRKALAKRPENRYQTAADLGEALAQYLFSRHIKITVHDLASFVTEELGPN